MLNLTTNESAGIILLLAITIFVVGWLIYNKFKIDQRRKNGNK